LKKIFAAGLTSAKQACDMFCDRACVHAGPEAAAKAAAFLLGEGLSCLRSGGVIPRLARAVGSSLRLLTYKQLGELGELAFARKAVSLGFHISVPWGESCAYDFIVDWRGRLNRVQVKCVSGRHARHCYQLNCCRRSTTPPRRLVHYRPNEVDFLAGCVVPENTWYIIPAALFCRRFSLTIPRDPRRGVAAACREAWHLLQR